MDALAEERGAQSSGSERSIEMVREELRGTERRLAEERAEAALAKAVEEEDRAGRIRPWTAMDGMVVGVALQEWTRAGVKV